MKKFIFELVDAKLEISRKIQTNWFMKKLKMRKKSLVIKCIPRSENVKIVSDIFATGFQLAVLFIFNFFIRQIHSNQALAD